MGAETTANEPHGRPIVLTEGPFEGWTTWGTGADPYETALGPFCFREEQGAVLAAFNPRAMHLNSAGAIHGGALMSFADFALFAIVHNALRGEKAVTLTCNCEFLAPGGLTARIEARGEMLRQTRSLVFARGLISQGGRTLASFSGTLKKISPPL